jgi:hypothetical protein
MVKNPRKPETAEETVKRWKKWMESLQTARTSRNQKTVKNKRKNYSQTDKLGTARCQSKRVWLNSHPIWLCANNARIEHQIEVHPIYLPGCVQCTYPYARALRLEACNAKEMVSYVCMCIVFMLVSYISNIILCLLVKIVHVHLSLSLFKIPK